MGAFNRRLQSKEIFGLPMVSMIGIVGVLAFGLLTLMLPWVLKIITGALLLICAGLIVIGLWLGEDLPLRGVMWAARLERGRVTAETWTKQ